jgi:hypothetical protein
MLICVMFGQLSSGSSAKDRLTPEDVSIVRPYPRTNFIHIATLLAWLLVQTVKCPALQSLDCCCLCFIFKIPYYYTATSGCFLLLHY